MKTKTKVKLYCIQANGKCFQHGLGSLWGVLLVHISPGLPAFHICQPPPAQVCSWFRLVRAPSPPQLPCKHNRSDYYWNEEAPSWYTGKK